MIIVRYGELALKGGNRAKFELKLIENIRDCLRKNEVEFGKIWRPRGRILIDSGKECEQLGNVFGISSFSYAETIDFDIVKLREKVRELIDGIEFTTFRVSASRIDKSVQMKSMDINVEIGQMIVDMGKKVSLKEFDLEIGIELLKEKAHVFIERHEGLKGLPYGINGKAVALIEDKASMLAAWLMMKRGLRIYPVATKKKDISILNEYNYGFPELALDIIKMDELDSYARRRRIVGIISGRDYDKPLDTGLLSLQPLVGFTKEETKIKIKEL